jgi:cytochrome c oxidase subunit 3
MNQAPAQPVAPQFDQIEQQHYAARLGMWVFLATELMFFGPLFLGYLYGRLEIPGAFADASRHTKVWLGTLNTALLLSSSTSMALAVEASRNGERDWVQRLLGLTAVLGLVFLIIKGIEYRQEWNEHLFPGRAFVYATPLRDGAQLFYIVYFATTALHALHLTIGIVMVLSLLWGCRYASPLYRPEHVEVGGLYWHFVDIVWIFLYPMLYLAGGVK